MFYYRVTEHIPSCVDVDRKKYANICFHLRDIFKLDWMQRIALSKDFVRWSISGHTNNNGHLLIVAHYTGDVYFVKAIATIDTRRFTVISEQCILDLKAAKEAKY